MCEQVWGSKQVIMYQPGSATQLYPFATPFLRNSSQVLHMPVCLIRMASTLLDQGFADCLLLRLGRWTLMLRIWVASHALQMPRPCAARCVRGRHCIYQSGGGTT